MKKILGLDLGTASIGWAVIERAEKTDESTRIVACGSRVVPLSSDEKDNFEKGKSITTNADRRLKRSMRRNLQRRNSRRDALIALLRSEGWIHADDVLSEEGKGTTHDTLRLRAKAAQEKISLLQLARVLLSINGKRGYKSSRKVDTGEEGQLIDGMSIAKELQLLQITPSEYRQRHILDGKPERFDFYRSDLENEYEKIWTFQRQFYPDILTEELHKQLQRQGKQGTSSVFLAKHGIYTADNKGKDKDKTAVTWRVAALTEKLEPDVLAYVISDIRRDIQNSSGYLGQISDRSKELFFNNETVGQYLFRHLQEDPLYSTRNKVFYRQDYIDEFNRIWTVQAGYHPELNDSLRRKIADQILFYQRPLKSQKGLVSFCEFESHPIEVLVDGKKQVKTTGSRCAPKASLLFQEFKIWQILNNLRIKDRVNDGERILSLDEKNLLSQELSIKRSMRQTEVLKHLGLAPRRYELNYPEIEGNTTLSALFSAYLSIVDLSGHGEHDINKLNYNQVLSVVQTVLPVLGCTNDIFHFQPDLPKQEYEQQPLFKLWHLLYSYEGDNSHTGKESLFRRISDLTGLDREYAKVLGAITFKDDYASLSHKAISKILPYLKEGDTYDKACTRAGYNHSHSETAKERDQKQLLDHLEQLPKGCLRNPVVEKILNQMVNVVNASTQAYGKPDEIHIELARELKQSAREREKATSDIEGNKKRNLEIVKILQEDFHITNVRKTDILRYRLYEELKENGFKTLYSDKYVPRDKLFSKEIDIEHIIPQARLFDDSFSNKTIEYKDINIEKGRRTAADFVKEKYGEEGYTRFRLRVDDLRNRGALSDKKRKNLLMTESDIPSGFVDRDIRNSQYISKKAQELLKDYVRIVIPTSGSVTARLREEWQLVDVMKELNFAKYEKAGKIAITEDIDGRKIRKIQDWTKRNDHRHHAMDAITIALTKPEHIQILNNLNARSDKDSVFFQMLQKETVVIGNKRIFTPPMPLDTLRGEVKRALNDTLISIKAKNKVVTNNINKTKTKNGYQRTTELTPRGPLHKEQVYGQRFRYETFEVTVNAKMTKEVIANVASKRLREALFIRLNEFDGDPKKAFTGKNALDKNPIYLDSLHTEKVPQKVKCTHLAPYYCIRKDIGPDLSIDKIIDTKVRSRIEERISEYGGNAKAALSNLDTNPIWLNDAKTIPIKRVTIGENFDLCAIHNKKDKNGQIILDADGNTIPSDFVNLRNNHHVALYLDAEGKVQESIVPFFEALNRVNQGLPVVDRMFHSDLGWEFLYSMKVNEMFVFPDEANGFYPQEIDLLNPANASLISPHLYRVQKLSSKDYYFRHHQETSIENDKALRDITWKRVLSTQSMKDVVKVRIDHLGRIVAIGEYD